MRVSMGSAYPAFVETSNAASAGGRSRKLRFFWKAGVGRCCCH